MSSSILVSTLSNNSSKMFLPYSQSGSTSFSSSNVTSLSPNEPLSLSFSSRETEQNTPKQLSTSLPVISNVPQPNSFSSSSSFSFSSIPMSALLLLNDQYSSRETQFRIESHVDLKGAQSSNLLSNSSLSSITPFSKMLLLNSTYSLQEKQIREESNIPLLGRQSSPVFSSNSFTFPSFTSSITSSSPTLTCLLAQMEQINSSYTQKANYLRLESDTPLLSTPTTTFTSPLSIAASCEQLLTSLSFYTIPTVSTDSSLDDYCECEDTVSDTWPSRSPRNHLTEYESRNVCLEEESLAADCINGYPTRDYPARERDGSFHPRNCGQFLQ